MLAEEPQVLKVRKIELIKQKLSIGIVVNCFFYGILANRTKLLSSIAFHSAIKKWAVNFLVSISTTFKHSNGFEIFFFCGSRYGRFVINKINPFALKIN